MTNAILKYSTYCAFLVRKYACNPTVIQIPGYSVPKVRYPGLR